MKPENLPSPQEARVLQLIAAHGPLVSPAQICEVSRKRISRDAIYSFLSRLQKKKLVDRTRGSGSYGLTADGAKVIALFKPEA